MPGQREMLLARYGDVNRDSIMVGGDALPRPPLFGDLPLSHHSRSQALRLPTNEICPLNLLITGLNLLPGAMLQLD